MQKASDLRSLLTVGIPSFGEHLESGQTANSHWELILVPGPCYRHQLCKTQHKQVWKEVSILWMPKSVVCHCFGIPAVASPALFPNNAVLMLLLSVSAVSARFQSGATHSSLRKRSLGNAVHFLGERKCHSIHSLSILLTVPCGGKQKLMELCSRSDLSPAMCMQLQSVGIFWARFAAFLLFKFIKIRASSETDFWG